MRCEGMPTSIVMLISHMKKILIYTFYSRYKITSRGLYEFRTNDNPFDTLFVPNRFSTDRLVDSIDQYDYVIGIADHSKNARRSRIDRAYINQYGQQPIIPNGIGVLKSNLEINLSESFYNFYGSTNGPCNRSAYLIMRRIIDEDIDIKFCFFHLNKKKWNADLKEIIESL